MNKNFSVMDFKEYLEKHADEIFNGHHNRQEQGMSTMTLDKAFDAVRDAREQAYADGDSRTGHALAEALVVLRERIDHLTSREAKGDSKYEKGWHAGYNEGMTHKGPASESFDKGYQAGLAHKTIGEAVATLIVHEDRELADNWGTVGLHYPLVAKMPAGDYLLYTHPAAQEADKTVSEVDDAMIDRAMTAYDEFLGSDDEADYEAMRAALIAATQDGGE